MTTNGAGGVRFWGFSPAVDLVDEVAASASGAADASDLLRVLMISPGDARHVLKTAAGCARRAAEGGASAAREVEFCVYEREPEVLARHMLLLAIALDFELPRRERAEVLLEVWANTQLREKTATYVAARAVALSRAISHEEGPLAPLLDTSALKSRDRDALESVLRTWAEDVEFDIVRLRDDRLRRFYGQRYDSRRNVLDWDYQMELIPIASIVHKIHFREWRMTGLCFEVRDSSYSAPNRTLASMASGREGGRSVMRRGFWGDIANGPFYATGIECENGEARLTNKRNDQVSVAVRWR
jgi:dynein assembly factor 3